MKLLLACAAQRALIFNSYPNRPWLMPFLLGFFPYFVACIVFAPSFAPMVRCLPGVCSYLACVPLCRLGMCVAITGQTEDNFRLYSMLRTKADVFGWRRVYVYVCVCVCVCAVHEFALAHLFQCAATNSYIILRVIELCLFYNLNPYPRSHPHSSYPPVLGPWSSVLGPRSFGM